MPESAYRSALAIRLAAIRAQAKTTETVNVSWNGSTAARTLAGDTTLLLEAVELVLSTRDSLAQSASLFVQSAAQWEDKGVEDKKALCLGQTMAYQSAAEHIDEALIAAFELWPQYESDTARDRQGTSSDQDVPR